MWHVKASIFTISYSYSVFNKFFFYALLYAQMVS